MTPSLASALNQIRDDIAAVLAPANNRQLCSQFGHSWQQRALDPITTIHLLVLQILHRNTACAHPQPLARQHRAAGRGIENDTFGIVRAGRIRSQAQPAKTHQSKRLNHDAMRHFLLRELDRAGLGHYTFSSPAIDLLVRSADGVLRKARNLGVGCLIEAVRSAKRKIDIDTVNRVLMQPHWQKDADLADY